MKAKFTMAGVNQYVKSQTQAYEDAIIEALKYQGEEFVNAARNKAPKSLITRLPKKGGFNDRTGNLRASIGYIILKNGEVIDSFFPGDTSNGVTSGKKAAAEVGEKYPNGIVLIGVAGMNYAAAVETLGFDVITGSAPKSKDIKDILGSIKINR